MHGSEYLKAFADSVLRRGGGDLDFALLVAMRGEKDGDGPLDHPCPICGPERSTPETQSAPKLRTWRPAPDCITYFCARCEAKGVAQASDPPRPNPLPRWVPPPTKPRASKGENDWYAKELWDASTELPAKARNYFKRRGIPIGDVPEGALRFHPECPWGHNRVPAIVAHYTDAVTGEGRGIWRRSLRSLDSHDKPKGLGTTKGCVIRLWPQEMVGKRLVLGEGIETTLAAATCVEFQGAALQPAWAAGDAGRMKSFPVLDGIEQLILLVDNDKSGTGQEAAEECAHRWHDAGRCVVRLIPPEVGTDFNDWVMSHD